MKLFIVMAEMGLLWGLAAILSRPEARHPAVEPTQLACAYNQGNHCPGEPPDPWQSHVPRASLS